MGNWIYSLRAMVLVRRGGVGVRGAAAIAQATAGCLWAVQSFFLWLGVHSLFAGDAPPGDPGVTAINTVSLVGLQALLLITAAYQATMTRRLLRWYRARERARLRTGGEHA